MSGTGRPAPSRRSSHHIVPRRRWRALAPGRVNLIGEHTDHNGLPVLPMALDREVRIDFTVLEEPVVRLAAAASEFRPFGFRLDGRIQRATRGDWSNYVRAAARGLRHRGLFLERGIEGVVEGNVPVASGLSSSSALVVASALALLKANDEMVPALELAALMAKAERFTGLEGGGMDQAACLCGVGGHALRIDFDPLRVTPVVVPKGWTWVVASSLVRAEKSRGAQEAYNVRARECKEALARVRGVLGGRRGGSGGSDSGASADGVGDQSRRNMLASRAAARLQSKVRQRNPGRSYRELLVAFGPDELLDVGERILGPAHFRRFRHVVTEAKRVDLAVDAMRAGKMAEFGALMIQSHQSLRDDYQVSTAALDEIVSVALEAGAVGARLTGAGFGGCAVALCEREAAPAVTTALAERFYAKRIPGPVPADVLFLARPAAGARVDRGRGVGVSRV